MCLGTGAHLSLVAPLLAQQSPDPAERTRGGIEEIIVEDEIGEGYRSDRAALGKLTEPLRDVPQSIVTVPRELFDDRGATSLNDALRTC